METFIRLDNECNEQNNSSRFQEVLAKAEMQGIRLSTLFKNSYLNAKEELEDRLFTICLELLIEGKDETSLSYFRVVDVSLLMKYMQIPDTNIWYSLLLFNPDIVPERALKSEELARFISNLNQQHRNIAPILVEMTRQSSSIEENRLVIKTINRHFSMSSVN